MNESFVTYCCCTDKNAWLLSVKSTVKNLLFLLVFWCCRGCPWKWTHLISVNLAYEWRLFLYVFLLSNLVFYFSCTIKSTGLMLQRTYIAAHRESNYDSSRLWLPTSCTLCAHERYPENDEPPKIYSNRKRFLLLCNVCVCAYMYIRRMNNRRKLIWYTIIASLLSREQPTISQIGLEDKQIGSRLGHRWLLHLSE